MSCLLGAGGMSPHPLDLCKKKPTTVSVISKILKKVLIKSSYLQKIKSQTGYKLMNCGLDLTLENCERKKRNIFGKSLFVNQLSLMYLDALTLLLKS